MHTSSLERLQPESILVIMLTPLRALQTSAVNVRGLDASLTLSDAAKGTRISAWSDRHKRQAIRTWRWPMP